MGIDIQPPGPEVSSGAGAASVIAHGTVTGPGAGGNIVTIAAGNMTAGQRYLVEVYYFLNGTTASPADDDNIRVLINGSTILLPPWNGENAAARSPVRAATTTPPYLGVTAVQVQAIGAATGTAIYHATVVATPLGD